MIDSETEIKLRKHEEKGISEDTPWEDDHLEREKSAQVLGRILKTIEQPFVVAINSPFGTGKSFFVNRLVQQFRNEGQVALYFNAWEKDGQGQPLLSFVGELQKQFSEHFGITKKRKSMKAVLKGAGNIALRKGLPIAARVTTAGFLGDDEIKAMGQAGQELVSGMGALAEGLVETQAQAESVFAAFKKDLEKAAADALSKKDEVAKAVYVFIDELDRCRPPYALELLENIKHLFSVPGMVFVLSIDRDHLKNSISTIYGSGMDSEGYLARFIDQNYRLPEPSHYAYAGFLFDRFGLDSVFAQRRDGRDDGDSIQKHFSELSGLFSLSLRDQEQAFAEINFVIRNITPKRAIFAPLLGQLAALKRYDYRVYEDYCHGRLTWEEMSQIISEKSLGNSWLNDRGTLFSRAWLLLGNSSDPMQLNAVVGQANERLNSFSASGKYTADMERERSELEPKRDLYSRAFEIMQAINNRYDMFFHGRSASLAKLIFSEFEIAQELSGN